MVHVLMASMMNIFRGSILTCASLYKSPERSGWSCEIAPNKNTARIPFDASYRLKVQIFTFHGDSRNTDVTARHESGENTNECSMNFSYTLCCIVLQKKSGTCSFSRAHAVTQALFAFGSNCEGDGERYTNTVDFKFSTCSFGVKTATG